MKTFRVFQFWGGSEATIREVTLPESVVDENEDKSMTTGPEGVRIGFLNAIFHYGQNEVQVQPTPSVSVGDIIELVLDGEYEHWVVANQGFENYGREKHFLFTISRPGNETIGA